MCRLHNDFLKVPLTGFKGTEISILMAICTKIKNKHLDYVEIPLSVLRALSGYRNKDKTQFITDILNVNKKLLTLNANYVVEADGKKEYYGFVLFTSYRLSEQSDSLILKINPEFEYLLNDFKRNFTDFEMQQLALLKSRYSILCFIFLKRWKNKGIWIVKIEDFKRMLDVPTSYGAREINKKIIPVVIAELSSIFKNLKINTVRDQHRKSHPIIRYEFRFDAEYKLARKSKDGSVNATTFEDEDSAKNNPNTLLYIQNDIPRLKAMLGGNPGTTKTD